MFENGPLAQRLDGLPATSGAAIQLHYDWARVAGSATGYDTVAIDLPSGLLRLHF